MRGKSYRRLVPVISFSLLLAGCGGGEESAANADSTLVLLTSSTAAIHLDPQRISGRAEAGFASAFLHRTLVAYSAGEATVSLQPDLADRKSTRLNSSHT